MTENEAIEELSNELRMITGIISYCRDFENNNDLALAYRIKRQKAMEAAISALKEIQQYQEIGTVEECRESREKQISKECVVDSCPDHTHYKCPSCGQIQMSTYANGFPRLGRIKKHCENCGQALVNENLEGRE